MTVRRPAALALLVIALVATLGHVCVLHVHAGHGNHGHDPIASGHTDSESHDHDSPEGSGVHVASCDVVGTSSAASPSMPPAWVVARAGIPTVSDHRIPEVVAKVRATGTSPPLFLLHAALLI